MIKILILTNLVTLLILWTAIFAFKEYEVIRKQEIIGIIRSSYFIGCMEENRYNKIECDKRSFLYVKKIEEIINIGE